MILMPAGLLARGRSIDLSAAYAQTSAVTTFSDPVFVGEEDYVSAAARQVRILADFQNFFSVPFRVSYQGLHIAPASQSAQGNRHDAAGYYSSYLHLSTAIDKGFFRWHFGFSALVTATTRSHASTEGIASDMAIHTGLSQVYPSGGFTLFPQAPIRISLLFLPGDSNLLYGWLRLQAELEIGNHTFSSSLEILNHASFGKGIPNFVQMPGAFVAGYALRLEQLRLFTRCGFVLNSTQGFGGARVGFSDRLLFELGAGYNFSL